MDETYEDFTYRMAVKQVCPNSLEPTTIYEKNSVKSYQAFAMNVINEYCRLQLLEGGIDYSLEEKLEEECAHEQIETMKFCVFCGKTFE